MKKHVPKLLLILLMLSFLGFTSFFVVHVHATTTVPSGIVYYVPVTLTNSQNSAVSSGSQVSIIVNWANYAFYLDNPVDNYVFFNSAGSTLYSWLESGTANTATSALLWLKIDSSIAASGGTYTVYLGFYAKGDNVLSSTGATGWAPQLSGTYGQYDNGANVFLVYFNGNSALSNFQVDPGSDDSVTSVSATFGSSTINAIMYTVGDAENSNDGLMYTGQSISASQNAIAESSFSSDGSGTDLGAIGLGSNDGQGVANNFISTSTQYSGAYFDQAFDDNTFSQSYVDFNEQGSTTTAWRYASITYNSTDYLYGYIAPQLYSISGGYDGTVNYADQGQSNPFAGVSNLYLFFYPDVGGSGAWIQYNWARARLYPPNGVMPSSRFGSGTASLSPISGNVGSSVTVMGSGFAANSLLSATFGGSSVTLSGSHTTDGSGNLPSGMTFTVPASTAGVQSVVVTDGSNFVSITFTVEPSIILSEYTGYVGDTVTIYGYGFAPDSPIDIGFGSPVTDSSGSFNVSVPVPASPAGVYTVGATDGEHNYAENTFTVIPAIILSPTSGHVGDTVTVSGSGFAAGSTTITATFGDSPVTLSVTSTDDSGSFSGATFTVPPSTAGVHSVVVTDGTNFGSAPFTVYAALNVGSASASASPITRGVGTSDMSVSVSGGSGSYTYRWSVEAPGASSFTDISGATSATYHFAPLSSATVGDYKFEVEVSDSVTSETGTSGSATVQVNSALATPVVTAAPTTVDQGQTSSLTSSSVTTGTPPYTYQWYSKAPGAGSYSSVGGATSSSYSFVTSTSTASGSWSFVLNVTDAVGASVNSTAATVLVDSQLVAPSVSASPGTVDRGQTSSLASFAVSTGTSPYTYQWLQKAPGAGSFSNIVSATSSSYSFVTSGSTTTGSWSFELRVTDAAGAQVTSSATSVMVNSAPSVSISSPTGPVTIDVGQSETFTASAAGGSGSYSHYQWYLGGSAVSGATSQSWIYSPPSAAVSTPVTVTVTDSLGATSAQSGSVSITVNSALVAPTVTSTPGTVDQGQASVLSSSAVSTGTSPYTYQWLQKAPGGSFSDVGLDSSSFSFVTSGSTTPGSWSFELQVTDGAGAVVTSSPVTVQVNSALATPVVTPAPTTVDQGQTSSLTSSTVTTGTPSYTYQWYSKLGAGSYSSVGGAISSSYNFVTSTSTTTGSWSFVLNVTDSVGVSVNSTAASVTVNSAPTVSVSPAGPLTMDVGQSQTFTASASGGTSPYTYQWNLDGVAVGTNSARYSYTAVAGSHQIYVNVTDSASTPYTAKSNVVSFMVNSAVSATISPSSVTMDVGQGQTFTASASGGSGTLSYQWYVDGSAVSGETGSTYTFTAGSVGSFSIYVKVTDSASVSVTVESNTATVTVNSALVAPTVTSTPGTVDQGQASVLSSSAVSTGTSPYMYEWFEKGPSDSAYSLISGAALDSYSFVTSTSTATGVWSFEIQVTDATGAAVNSTAASATVHSALVAPTVSASLSTVDQSQTSSLASSAVTTGTSPLSYQWMEKAPGDSSFSVISGVTSSSYNFITSGSTATGLWSFGLQVTDGAGAVVASNVVTVTVNAAPTVTVSPTSWTMDAGQSTTFTATASGGSGTYSSSTGYQWYVDSTLQSGKTASTFSYSPVSSGSYLITVTVTDSLGVPSAPSSAAAVTVNHASAVSITLSPAGSATITAGDSKTYSATGSDAYGNTWDVTSSTSWSISSGAGGSWSSNVYTSATAGSWTVTGIYNSAPYTIGLTVNPADATYLVVSSGTSQVADTAFSVTVTAEDAYGNTATGYTGTVHFNSSDSGSGVSLPSDYTFLSGDLGTHTFTDGVTLVTAGTESVTATDTVTESITGSQSGITVDHASAASIAITPATATITAGNAETYTATASDAYGNSWDVTSSTTWSISSGAGGSWSSNVYTSATAGSWTVTGIYNSAPYTTGLTVTPAGLNSITISPVSPSIVAGGSQTFSAEGFDQYGNDLGSITASYSVNGASITGSSVSETLVGSYTVTASCGGYTADATLTVNVGALDHFVFSSVGSQTAGSAFSITVTAVDASGNTVTGYTGTQSLSYSAGTISPSTMGAFVNGVGTTTVTVTAAGSGVTITATDGSHTGTSNSFTVNPTITASAGANGTISPSGSVSVNYGSSQSFTITPSTGYSIASLIVDGSPVTVASSYTFSNVQAAHTITASFAINTTTTTIIIGIESNTTIVPIILEGNITAQQMLTNVTITPNPLTTTTTLSFTITGPSGTVGFGNMTLPKTAIPYGTTPVVYIDGQQAPNQGYTQDANNFYVWYTTHFSTHQVSIQFTVPPATSLGLALAVVMTVAAIILVFIAIASQRLRRKSDNITKP